MIKIINSKVTDSSDNGAIFMPKVCYWELIMSRLQNKIAVVKVGTSTLTKAYKHGVYELDMESFSRIGKQIVALQRNGYCIAIVSSAAITAGMMITRTTMRPATTEQSMPNLQALASIGWRHVLNRWSDALKGVVVAELLITKNELEFESERSELLNVTQNLMANGYIAIINENDAITHEEIAFGDNDSLAALFASKLKQSELFSDDISLIILSDVDGVYENIKDSTSVIERIEDIDTYRHLAGGAGSSMGTGGMATKFAAATIAVNNAVDMYIANGRRNNVLKDTIQRKTGTLFIGA